MSHENKNEIALNTHLFLYLFIFAFFQLFADISPLEHDVIGAIVFVLFNVCIIFVFFISPLYFVFDECSVTIVYHFGQRESILWRDILSVYIKDKRIGKGILTNYVFNYPRKEQRKFFIRGEIPKTRKTKKLIEKYYKKKIK